MNKELKYEFAYDELSIVISQQEILQQKVSILMAINTGLMAIVIGSLISIGAPWYANLFASFYLLWPLAINIYILLPQFNRGATSKYFYDFSEMSREEIAEHMEDNKENVFDQIRVNSKILRDKYNWFRVSLILTFLGIPLIFLITKKK